VPLGDKYERRSLILFLLCGAFASLVMMALAPNVWCLAWRLFSLGPLRPASMSSCLLPRISPLRHNGAAWSASWSPAFSWEYCSREPSANARGLARLARRLTGWRRGHAHSCAVLRLQLPISRPETTISWRELMTSTLALVRQHARLRESALLGALLFAGFSAFWTTLVFFLAEPPYAVASPSAAAGLFGSSAPLGAWAAPGIGHLAGTMAALHHFASGSGARRGDGVGRLGEEEDEGGPEGEKPAKSKAPRRADSRSRRVAARGRGWRSMSSRQEMVVSGRLMEAAGANTAPRMSMAAAASP